MLTSTFALGQLQKVVYDCINVASVSPAHAANEIIIEYEALLQCNMHGPEEHTTDLHVAQDIEGVDISQANFDRIHQLLASAGAVQTN